MLNSKKPLEHYLQQYRFRKLLPFLQGSVLDFGGNEGELRPYVKGDYSIVNYDYSGLEGKQFDTIVALAVIEHIEVTHVAEIFRMFKKMLAPGGQLFLTTPTAAAKPVLEMLAFTGILDKANIAEHKHYWSRNELLTLASDSGFRVDKYEKFQLGFNQLALLKHNN
ncbi:MAG: SAM-dependent methyltransferase [Ferruginibacter sp.]|nr:SAM-dependent methyltransferase [Ferruginibacter sp.]